MDTRQLAAFCAVVERKSFSQAAERLGVTQPAVSLQIRSLEQRLGRQLLDRSGRRVEPTEAGLRLYASAQRLLALEEHLLEELDADNEGEITGTLELGASTGPGGTVVPLLLCEFQEQHPDIRIRLTVSDTQTLIDRVAERELELGIVGAGRRHRGVSFEPFFRDEVVLACPPGHRFAGKTISLDELKGEQLIVMQEGAGVRQVLEDELRKAGMRLRDLDVKLELGLQESVRSAVLAGHGIAFISRLAIEADLEARRVATARVRGLDPVREILLARASGRSETRAARAFIAFTQERLPT
ncbi:MAG: LysR family transcriptional regulator, transcriptional activator of the cysJI operon [Gaiellaceae bacterium]|jgi:DNA-binding transcriptional LysR family regulator|nr:LysR family transcriptional regulator, transcriptional activator of the cysJI operon [Gaiellaceae bacterium]